MYCLMFVDNLDHTRVVINSDCRDKRNAEFLLSDRKANGDAFPAEFVCRTTRARYNELMHYETHSAPPVSPATGGAVPAVASNGGGGDLCERIQQVLDDEHDANVERALRSRGY